MVTNGDDDRGRATLILFTKTSSLLLVLPFSSSSKRRSSGIVTGRFSPVTARRRGITMTTKDNSSVACTVSGSGTCMNTSMRLSASAPKRRQDVSRSRMPLLTTLLILGHTTSMTTCLGRKMLRILIQAKSLHSMNIQPSVSSRSIYQLAHHGRGSGPARLGTRELHGIAHWYCHGQCHGIGSNIHTYGLSFYFIWIRIPLIVVVLIMMLDEQHLRRRC
jgi:hypothetical protein